MKTAALVLHQKRVVTAKPRSMETTTGTPWTNTGKRSVPTSATKKNMPTGSKSKQKLRLVRRPLRWKESQMETGERMPT